MRVLYIDDDRINTLLFEQACRLIETVEVETAGSGAEALALLLRWTPDLLVVDLHLPDTDGFALLQVLRTRLPDPPPPAYLCTADEWTWAEAEARRAGFDGCWSKPVHPRELVRLLNGLGPDASR
jgi:CheY-like chemotaxis protein